jgi:hypothetical protein
MLKTKKAWKRAVSPVLVVILIIARAARVDSGTIGTARAAIRIGSD